MNNTGIKSRETIPATAFFKVSRFWIAAPMTAPKGPAVAPFTAPEIEAIALPT